MNVNVVMPADFSHPAKPVSFQESQMEAIIRILGLTHSQLECYVNNILHYLESVLDVLLTSRWNIFWSLQLLCEIRQQINNRQNE